MRKVLGTVGLIAFVVGGINVTDYTIARKARSQGYSTEQVEERFDYSKLMTNGDPLGAVLAVVGKPGRAFAYRQ